MRPIGRSHMTVLAVVVVALLSLICNRNQLKFVRSAYQSKSHSSDRQSNETSPDGAAKRFGTAESATLAENHHDDSMPTTTFTASHKDSCQPVVGEIQTLHRNDVAMYSNLTTFLKLETQHQADGIDGNHAAPGQHRYACEFKATPHSNHFAHSMQQLYGCWAFLHGINQDNNPTEEKKDILPALIIQPKVRKRLDKNPFLNGFLKAIQNQGSVSILGRNQFLTMSANEATQNSTTVSSTRAAVASIDIQGGYTIKYVQALRDTIQKELGLNNISTAYAPPLPPACSIEPKISILNRRKSQGRSLLNIDALVSGIKTALETRNEIEVAYFEGASFLDQISFFHGTDIAISPHGAQLTGIPFLGTTPCSGVLEIFPKGYAIPEFYGSLALGAGHHYDFLYLSTGNRSQEQVASMQERVQVRASNLCPSTDIVVEAVIQLTRQVKECCLQLHRHKQPS